MKFVRVKNDMKFSKRKKKMGELEKDSHFHSYFHLTLSFLLVK